MLLMSVGDRNNSRADTYSANGVMLYVKEGAHGCNIFAQLGRLLLLGNVCNKTPVTTGAATGTKRLGRRLGKSPPPWVSNGIRNGY